MFRSERNQAQRIGLRRRTNLPMPGVTIAVRILSSHYQLRVTIMLGRGTHQHCDGAVGHRTSSQEERRGESPKTKFDAEMGSHNLNL